MHLQRVLWPRGRVVGRRYHFRHLTTLLVLSQHISGVSSTRVIHPFFTACFIHPIIYKQQSAGVNRH